MTRKITIELISILLILLFVYAAISKLVDIENFKVQLGQSPLLTAFVSLVWWMIPSIEISIALLLAFPKTRLIGLYSSFTLMVMFTAYIIAILKFSDYIPCSCGGILQHMTWSTHLKFNVVFVFLAGIATVIYKPRNNEVV